MDKRLQVFLHPVLPFVSKLHRMKPSAWVASLFIFLFFLFFNGLQAYLIMERISETKTRFGFVCTDALVSSLNEYNKLKAIDSTLMPTHAWIAYSSQKIEISRPDTQSVQLSAPLSRLVTDSIEPAYIETILNSPSFRTINLDSFNRLYQKALHLKHIRAAYRLDTIMQGNKANRPPLPALWNKKRSKAYPFSTRPMRNPQYAGYAVFAQFKYDASFFKNELLWPMIAFAFILLIGNAALVFVYNTIRKQKRINELKTDFINNITHEMKTPITIASAGLEAMEHYINPAERTNFYLQTSKKQLRLLNEFVERILDAAVSDISDFTLKKEKTDLHALIVELVQSRSVLQGKPASIRLTGEGPMFLQGDRLHLETAFHNIIDNAIKYSNDSADISIDLIENNRECIIKIRDNGIGIPPQFINNIFEKFFRVPQGDAHSVKGFGLGLYYVSSIVKKHSGNITVHSKWQSGTEFIITLPKKA
jgi:two-component system, OmpR family, phosphate regulon sensor histidine kinase PhoR